MLLFKTGKVTSYVQVRGSIPLLWASPVSSNSFSFSLCCYSLTMTRMIGMKSILTSASLLCFLLLSIHILFTLHLPSPAPSFLPLYPWYHHFRYIWSMILSCTSEIINPTTRTLWSLYKSPRSVQRNISNIFWTATGAPTPPPSLSPSPSLSLPLQNNNNNIGCDESDEHINPMSTILLLLLLLFLFLLLRSDNNRRSGVVCVNLIDNKSDQGKLGKAFAEVFSQCKESLSVNANSKSHGNLNGIDMHYIWFDFHHETKQKGKWDNLYKLTVKCHSFLDDQKFFCREMSGMITSWQTGESLPALS